jgi:hypothetical protein
LNYKVCCPDLYYNSLILKTTEGVQEQGSKENRPKRDEVAGERRKLHSEELHSLYSSPNIIRQIKSRRMRWAGHVVHTGEGRKVYKVLVGKTEAKRSLKILRHGQEDGITMDLREIGSMV